MKDVGWLRDGIAGALGWDAVVADGVAQAIADAGARGRCRSQLLNPFDPSLCTSFLTLCYELDPLPVSNLSPAAAATPIILASWPRTAAGRPPEADARKQRDTATVSSL